MIREEFYGLERLELFELLVELKLLFFPFITPRYSSLFMFVHVNASSVALSN